MKLTINGRDYEIPDGSTGEQAAEILRAHGFDATAIERLREPPPPPRNRAERRRSGR